MHDLAASVRNVLASAPSVAAAWIFGSMARGDVRDDSDLDVAILLRDPTSTAASESEELLQLAAMLEKAAGRAVDVVVLGLMDPIIAHRVLSEGTLVFDEDPDRRIDFTSDVLSRYLDWAPLYEATAARSLDANRAWARGKGS